MRVLMLGWEFPPFISGGLGTACYGLTKAMSRQNLHVTFVLPKAVDSEYTSHVRLLSPQSPRAAGGTRDGQSVASTYAVDDAELENVEFKAVPARSVFTYTTGDSLHGSHDQRNEQVYQALQRLAANRETWQAEAQPSNDSQPSQATNYDGDLMAETQRYADLCLDFAREANFDVIHAHDWLTYPAAMAVAGATGKPLVVHVHSTEFDRAGNNIHQKVYDIERRGMQAAVRVICVSYLTASIVQHRYGIAMDKIRVVYNGIESNGNGPVIGRRTAIRKGDKIVLFLGRITMQKGPEYFVMAAKKVLEKMGNVKFIMAGSGDMAPAITALAKQEGISNEVLFTGFLRGPDVEQIFKLADVYVMPSVSEPFGIAPLEAISHDVPVIISRQSGVAEVLTHALKVDFWDTDDIANKILAVLRHPPLGATLREHADIEVRQLTWDGAAVRCREIYEEAFSAMPRY